MERRLSVLKLILLVALAACAVVAVWNCWRLASKADSRSEKFRSLARIAAGVGGALFVLPLVAGVHGLGLKGFVAGGILCLLCNLFFVGKSSGATGGRSDL
jgi:predicted membrane channel-forming protein YqfA (hemolysin III family)